jgi:multisubunit Na+/H+ antiporter MnhE subunit
VFFRRIKPKVQNPHLLIFREGSHWLLMVTRLAFVQFFLSFICSLIIFDLFHHFHYLSHKRRQIHWPARSNEIAINDHFLVFPDATR